MSNYKLRLKEYDQLFSEPKTDLKKLRKLCFDGIPDRPSLRSLSWKLLLHYLPPDRADWEDFLAKKRALYKHYIEEIVAHPDNSNQTSSFDHPLNENPNSQWITFFKDNEILLQIDRDVRRLSPDISFFQQPTTYSIYRILGNDGTFETLTKRVEKCILESSVIATTKGGLRNVILKKLRGESYEVLPDGQEAHWQVVERMLFIYAKLNPGIAYVQGMNEIIGPLYYTFASDPDVKWQEHAEADSFFCFTSIMGEIRDNFLKSLDDSAHGIGQEMNKLLCMLQVIDGELWKDLDRKQMKPEFFAFRWITLLLSQEFNLPDIIRLWDSLFADPDRFEILLYVCCAMLVLLRDRILAGDFAVTLKLVQNFPHDEIDIATVIRKAVELKTNKYNEPQPAPRESHPPTGKGVSLRGLNLKKRLSHITRGELT